MATFILLPARYAKDQMLVQPTTTSKWKERIHRLAEHLGGRWTHRERGYVMSRSKAQKLQQLYDDGFDASPGMPRFGIKSKLEAPKKAPK